MAICEPVPEAGDLARFEPTPYDLGIADDPEVAWPDVQPSSYVTEIGYPPAGNGVLHSLHRPMPEPELLPEPELEVEL